MKMTCGGRFLERLEQRVEARIREHVDLVHDVELVPAAGRRVLHVVDDQFADLVHLGVRGGVEFQHVQAAPLGDLLALRAHAARLGRRPVLAIERLGQDARGRGLAGAARPDEEVGVREPLLLDGVFERLRNMRLADDLVEILRAIFAGENLVAHGIGHSNLPGTETRNGICENRKSVAEFKRRDAEGALERQGI